MTTTQHTHFGSTRRLRIATACLVAFFGVGGLISAGSAAATSQPGITVAPATPTATTSAV